MPNPSGLYKRGRSVPFLSSLGSLGRSTSAQRQKEIIAIKETKKFSDCTIVWALTLAAVALTVFGAKVLLIAQYGSFIPFWDQWDGEAAGLYLPYLKSQLPFATLLAPHNEHRILLPRLLFLALFEFSGEWRPPLQMIVNAGLNAGFAVLIAGLASILANLQDRLFAAATVALVLCLPLAWHSTVSGFHTPWYLLVIFITLAIAALASAVAFSALWWAGVAASVLAYFTIASGVLAIPAAAGIVTLQLLIKERRGAREVSALALLVLTAAIMLACTPSIPGNQQLKATGVTQFLYALLKLASWPLPPGIAVAQLPIVALAYTCIVQRLPRTNLCWTVVGIGVFAWLQMVLLAFGRAGGVTESRYLDMLSVSLALNFIAFLFLVRQVPQASIQRIWAQLLIAWTLAIGIGLAFATGHAMRGAAAQGQLYQLEVKNVNAYLAGDRLALRDKPPLHIPYPSAERLENLLDDPMIVAFLPRELRKGQSAGPEIRSHLFLKGRFSEIALHLEKVILEAKYLFLVLGIAAFLLAWFLTRQLRPCGTLIQES